MQVTVWWWWSETRTSGVVFFFFFFVVVVVVVVVATSIDATSDEKKLWRQQQSVRAPRFSSDQLSSRESSRQAKNLDLTCHPLMGRSFKTRPKKKPSNFHVLGLLGVLGLSSLSGLSRLSLLSGLWLRHYFPWNLHPLKDQTQGIRYFLTQ